MPAFSFVFELFFYEELFSSFPVSRGQRILCLLSSGLPGKLQRRLQRKLQRRLRRGLRRRLRRGLRRNLQRMLQRRLQRVTAMEKTVDLISYEVTRRSETMLAAASCSECEPCLMSAAQKPSDGLQTVRLLRCQRLGGRGTARSRKFWPRTWTRRSRWRS